MADVTELKNIACEAIDNHAGELREVNRKIWENPELAFQEKSAQAAQPLLLRHCIYKFIY